MTCPYDADGDGDCHPCRPEGYPEGLEAVFLPVAVVDRMAVSRNTADDSYELEFAARKAQARRGMAERLSRALDIPPELLDSPVSNHWSARDPFAGSALVDFMEPFQGEVTYGCRTTVAHWDGEHWVVEDVDPPSNL